MSGSDSDGLDHGWMSADFSFDSSLQSGECSNSCLLNFLCVHLDVLFFACHDVHTSISYRQRFTFVSS